MISKASDYQFVTGDLDKIQIDGGIMPLRANPYELRGEDITFLMEAAFERYKAAISPTSSSWLTFSRIVSASQINALSEFMTRFLYQHQAVVSRENKTYWLNDDTITEGAIVWPSSGGWLDYPFLGMYIERSEIVPAVDVSVKSGDAILKAPIQSMFDALARTHRWLCDKSTESIIPSEWTADVNPSIGYIPLTYNYIFDKSVVWSQNHTDEGDDYQLVRDYKATASFDLVVASDKLRSAKTVDVWGLVGFRAYRDHWVGGECVERMSEYCNNYLVHVGTVCHDGSNSIAFNIKETASRTLDLIKSELGVEPEERAATPGSSCSYYESFYSTLTGIYCVCDLRDRTRW